MKRGMMLLLALLMTQLAWGGRNIAGKWHGSRTALIYDYTHTINVNLLEMFVYNYGNFAYDNANIYGKTDGLYYPRGTAKTVIYAAGIWMGAKVDNQISLAIAEYSAEFVPGPMENGTFLPDRPEFKVYKINRGDNETNPDYANWPAAMGAPTDSLEKPAILGDQMTWAVYNDADTAHHINNAGATNPLGVEIQQSIYAFGRSGALGKCIFLKYSIINKGNHQLDSVFVSFWADPDIGDAGGDLVGCDTALLLGYCYNSGEDAIYGTAPPAVGFRLLQGPIVPGTPADTAYISGQPRPGFRNLPMTSFNKYINGTDPESATESFRYMRGLNRDGTPMVNPITSDVTAFAVSGDPQTGSGWIDSAPADRRFMVNSGPFTMAPGDSQEVIVAVLVGQGTDPINSIGVLKRMARQLNVECGDFDDSHEVNLSDIVFLVQYIFAGGSEPVDSREGDVNCDGKTNISDAVYLVSYIFGDGSAPCLGC